MRDGRHCNARINAAHVQKRARVPRKTAPPLKKKREGHPKVPLSIHLELAYDAFSLCGSRFSPLA